MELSTRIIPMSNGRVQKTTPSTTSTIETIPKKPQGASGFNKKNISKSNATETENYLREVKYVKGKDENAMVQDQVKPITVITDTIIDHVYYLIKVALIAMFTLAFAFFTFLIIYKQCKMSTNPIDSSILFYSKKSLVDHTNFVLN